MDQFCFKIYTCSKNGFAGSDYYNLTMEDMTKRCCILDGVLCWENSIPQERNWDVDVQFPGFYDIWNYECFPWYDCPRLTEKCREAAKERGHYAEDNQEYEKNKQEIINKISELKNDEQTTVSGIQCKRCGNTLPPHTIAEHLDVSHPIHKCPHEKNI